MPKLICKMAYHMCANNVGHGFICKVANHVSANSMGHVKWHIICMQTYGISVYETYLSF